MARHWDLSCRDGRAAALSSVCSSEWCTLGPKHRHLAMLLIMQAHDEIVIAEDYLEEENDCFLKQNLECTEEEIDALTDELESRLGEQPRQAFSDVIEGHRTLNGLMKSAERHGGRRPLPVKFVGPAVAEEWHYVFQERRCLRYEPLSVYKEIWEWALENGLDPRTGEVARG